MRGCGSEDWGLVVGAAKVMLLTQSEVNSRMLPWGDAEFRRFAFRLALFTRRGMRDPESVADRLALRDQERDDRRMCCECSHLQQPGTCFAAQQGWLPNTSTRHAPVTDLLFRCEQFNFVKP